MVFIYAGFGLTLFLSRRAASQSPAYPSVSIILIFCVIKAPTNSVLYMGKEAFLFFYIEFFIYKYKLKKASSLC